jgi:hypothetical protein
MIAVCPGTTRGARTRQGPPPTEAAQGGQSIIQITETASADGNVVKRCVTICGTSLG